MNDEQLKRIKTFIEDQDIVVMWNDGYDKYIILNNVVHKCGDELYVNFKDHRGKHIDLNNCVLSEFLIFRKEK